MFSTRLRVVLIGIAVLLLGLFARAVQVQWAQHAYWEEQAQGRLEHVGKLETSRGRILDYKGRELAVDAPCIDAVVDYRAITRPPNERWVREVARERLRRKLGTDYFKAERQQQQQLLDDMILQVKQDLEDMWHALGTQSITGQTPEQIEDRRQQIVRKVQMQKRYLWYKRFVAAGKRQEEQSKESPWWQRWLMEDSDLDQDAFDVTVDEEIRPHVVLPAITTELANTIGKNLDRFPGLSLQPGQHRIYPYGEAACHVIGNLAAVTAEDVKNDPEKNDLRKYFPTDQIGRQGVEALCESVLRGTRGQWRKGVSQAAQIEAMPQPGADVKLSIDVELQRKVEAAFVRRKLPGGEMDTTPMHGAAILLDVPTGQVRAMVSYPTYDLNTLAQSYGDLVKDEINKPLINRATMSQLEPGSTVKPIVGLAGITEKVVGVHEGIECDGHLKLNGTTFLSYGRCWSIRLATPLPHHSNPGAPHRGSFGNQDGWLIYADALERSCNVWPETVADRLGMERLKRWYGLMGLGRPTGLGIPEASGRLPQAPRGPVRLERSATWFAGIGQGIGATPIQMANVAATIARDGTWMRPQLVSSGFEIPTTSPSDSRVVLPVDRRAISEARRGMENVVNAPGATGRALMREDMKVAGKTGTAQAARFSVVLRDESGDVLKENGRTKRRYLEPSTSTWTNPEAPWYRGSGKDDKELTHAWFIGFAPADHPQVAFAVMVEYGGSGGAVGGPIANALLDAAIEEGYLATARPKP